MVVIWLSNIGWFVKALKSSCFLLTTYVMPNEKKMFNKCTQPVLIQFFLAFEAIRLPIFSRLSTEGRSLLWGENELNFNWWRQLHLGQLFVIHTAEYVRARGRITSEDLFNSGVLKAKGELN